jgi:hypothetical protein
MAIFAAVVVAGLLIITLRQDRELRTVRGRPAAADRRLLRVFAIAALLALISFYVWFRINPAPGALL